MLGIVTEERLSHSKNAAKSIVTTVYVTPPYVTDEGMVKAPDGLEKPYQPLKGSLLFGNVTLTVVDDKIS